jgi:hypothetical protein
MKSSGVNFMVSILSMEIPEKASWRLLARLSHCSAIMSGREPVFITHTGICARSALQLQEHQRYVE